MQSDKCRIILNTAVPEEKAFILSETFDLSPSLKNLYICIYICLSVKQFLLSPECTNIQTKCKIKTKY